ncbi:MAG: hypothetical protein DCF22_13460 [Leptolyngbya sp.]|nr:MAG: hypothetical protein DCF22_13460 [Leptolyngbya sp.]
MEELPKQEVIISIFDAMLARREEDYVDFIPVIEAVYLSLPEDYCKAILESLADYDPFWVQVIDRFDLF